MLQRVLLPVRVVVVAGLQLLLLLVKVQHVLLCSVHHHARQVCMLLPREGLFINRHGNCGWHMVADGSRNHCLPAIVVQSLLAGMVLLLQAILVLQGHVLWRLLAGVLQRVLVVACILLLL